MGHPPYLVAEWQKTDHPITGTESRRRPGQFYLVDGVDSGCFGLCRFLDSFERNNEGLPDHAVRRA